ncbi:TlpA family protein disulfide reductase [Geomonas sp. RF6]|uniref:peroxiredoxin family protein n=1 Tax=Geomonas sp. RF6 TaxID=2897342 RepID=UPI001E2F06B8|nr:TlpA disulfide reductase family protein [Geomonas sp. RF6]UFS70732.1 TlpA family protein disulfide reductase [Geomonas sp. RF6]
MRKVLQLLAALVLLQPLLPAGGEGLLQTSAPAPPFTLTDLKGRTVQVGGPQEREILLYFFDIGSPSSRAGLKAVDLIARRHRRDVAVYAISASAPEVIATFLAKEGITLSVLRDTKGVCDLYQGRRVLPVGCLIGRDSKVIEYYRGGGEGLEAAMRKAIDRTVRGKDAVSVRPLKAATKVAPPARGERVMSRSRSEQKSVVPPHSRPEKAAESTAAEEPQNEVGKLLKPGDW